MFTDILRDSLMVARYVAGFLCGMALAFWVTLPALVQTLLIVMVLDAAIGFTRALQRHRLNKQKSFEGATKKAIVLLLVFVVYRLQIHFGNAFPLAETTSGFYIMHFGLSVLHNMTAMGIPVPDGLKKALKTMDKGDTELKPVPVASAEAVGSNKE